ncbi:MAG: protein kinase [Chloroflexota bacterium]|nr:protein kinase [Chloroflexota bacterium]
MASSDLFVGRELGGFIIQERIARGGMATVYRAFQPSVNRAIALKVITLDPTQSEREEFRQRFAQEANVIASLEHIHILPIYDYGIVDNEVAYIAMRLLRGGTLADLLHAGKPLETNRMAEIFTQMARGLAFAHSRGVIHRDLKPSNIMLDDADNAYLTDFGLAKFIDTSMDLTRTGHIVGTPVYMSPEQLKGEVLDHRSDIYSLGVILYHMLVGKPPFDASDTNMVSVIYQHLEKDPVPPRDLVPSILESVETVALKALRKDPMRRYNSADEMATELNIALGRRVSTANYPAVHTPPPTQASMPKPEQARNRAFGVALAVIVLIAIVGIIVILATAPPPPVPLTPPTIIADARGRAAEVVPTDAEIALAQRRVGDDGFLAYAACNQTSEYHATQAREMGDFARAYGLAYRIYDSNNDSYDQLTQLERARSDGASALIICPLDDSLIAEALTSIQSAGLPLILMSSSIDSYGGVRVAGDDYLMGVEAGRAAGRIIQAERNGQAQVIILDYPSLNTIVARADGLADGISEISRQANIIGRYLGATRENGYATVRQLLADGVAFDVILSINDNGSFGAIQALEEAGIPADQVIISSVDAEALARQFMSDGNYMRASVDVGREAFSRVAVAVAVKLLAGATLSETILVPPVGVVTRETVLALTPAAE